MIQYKVVLNQDVESDKTTSNVEVLARVLDISDGNEKKAEGGDVIFRYRGATDTKRPVVNGAAKLTFEKTREDEKQSLRVHAEYADPRGIIASDSIIVEIPAKQSQKPSGSHPKITLFLAKPIADPQDTETDFKVVATIHAPADKLDACYPVEVYLDDAQQAGKPLTEKRTGEAHIKMAVPRAPRKQEYRMTARVTIEGRLYVSNPQPVFIEALRPKEEWEFSRLDLDLKGQRHDSSVPDHSRFILTVQAIPYEKLKTDPTKERKMKLDPDGYAIKFKKNWEPGFLKEQPETDKHGFAEIEMEIASEDRDKRMTFIAEAESNGKTWMSNEWHATLPAKAKKNATAAATTVEVYCNDNMAQIRAKDKDNKLCPAAMTMLSDRPTVVIRDQQNHVVTGDVNIPENGATFFFFDDPSPAPADASKPYDPSPATLRVTFSVANITPITKLVFPRSK